MRTNFDSDDELIAAAIRDSKAVTTPAAIDEALRVAGQIRRQAGLRRIRGKVRWEGDLDAMRTDRSES
jgi:Arc/MetJ family transcription regulator